MLDLVEQSPIANIKQPGCSFAIPLSLLQGIGNCRAFSFTLHGSE
jgi:hypothetical protein